MTSKINILVTDGNYKHSLAAIRSLAKSGGQFRIIACSHRKVFLSMFSRCLDDHLLCPDPVGQPDKYSDWLTDRYRSDKIDIIMPIGSETNLAVSRIDSDLVCKKSLVPKSDIASMASDKAKTASEMESLGVRIPRTIAVNSLDEIENAYLELNKNIVIKPVSGASAMGLYYISNDDDLAKAKSELRSQKTLAYVAQEKIEGSGVGYFGLYDRGQRLAYFMHKRLREFPLSGGISVFSRSYQNQSLFELGHSIFERLSWSGVGMLEFKQEKDSGQYVLIEINPKFWGSLELAIVSGVDFPNLYVKRLLGQSFPEPEFTDNVTFNWTMPWNALNFMSTLMGRHIDPVQKGSAGHYSDFNCTDIKPYLYQIALFPYYLYRERDRL